MRVISSSEDFMFFRGDHFLFGSVFIRKGNQIEFFLKNWNRVKLTCFGSVQFGFLEPKSV
jgi:hypothetical protein